VAVALFSVVPEQGEQDDNWKRDTKQPQEGASTEAHVNLLTTNIHTTAKIVPWFPRKPHQLLISIHPGAVRQAV
jgi:hypothetical protein